MTLRNYARNIQTKQVIFFDLGSVPPPLVREHPMSWALWTRPDDDRYYRLIGEGLDDYCASFSHRPKQCKYCRAPMPNYINPKLPTYGTKENPSPAYLAKERS